MSSAHKNLSVYNTDDIIDISNKKFAVVVAEWNEEITGALYQGVFNTLLKHGAQKENILKIDVPGSYELSYGSQVYAAKEEIDAVIAIGCVIQGETKHNDYINNAVAQGLTSVSLKYNKPVIFGVLTPNTHQQAVDRAGGIHGNKGDEAAITAVKMLGLK
ncbi:6,7-dimethyl-8-ribityllumazine synthase [Arcticibacterium luteifluviistationis]|uniref:6,7-dimethyl-8-ribityllumazine synthase n=1 Tax=Arcticibacterium luteifluviistationis TaxID=1784714 RepID=A0A2Z4GEN6_9BACT|nr:6,7-dimethyl-8-ribityllumazine synthase [Arcticibacterium luteifluviistationis]AWV99726.1 6,7-dimethyl-8-ribityllumazine synthase [Arcticibacterium luteifluviistationis]